MIIWLLGLLLFASLGFAGYTLGVIRVAFSFVGLLVASLLALPLGHVLNSPLSSLGVKNPLLLGVLAPFIMFVIILTIFKIAGYAVHRKIDVYYKYKAGDIRMGLWNRLSPRLGACLGMANATVYLILISLLIYMFSYPTAQMVVNENTTTPIKLLNNAGKDLQSTGMAKITAAIDPMPDSYYHASDIMGLIYHNDLLEARLSRYPAFLGLDEKPEFQAIGEDKQFSEMRQRQDPILNILAHDKAQAIVNNPAMLKEIWSKVEPNLTDLENYLKTGKSETYDSEKILGRWTVNVPRVMGLVRQAKPNMSGIEIQKIRAILQLTFAKTTLVATAEKEVFLKNLNQVKMAEQKQPPNQPPPRCPARAPVMVPTVVGTETVHGTWSSSGNGYTLSMEKIGELKAIIDGDRMTITGFAGAPMALDKEY
jgi:hypothetical protein